MKQINKLIAAVLLSASSVVSAQNGDQPWALSLGINTIDGGRVSSGDFEAKDLIDTDSWSTIHSISSLNLSRNLYGGLSLGVTGTVNRMNNYVEKAVAEDTENNIKGIPSSIVEVSEMYYGIDGQLKYSFGTLNGWFDPSIFVSGGYTMLGDLATPHVGGGLGLNIWVTKNIALGFSSTYKHQLEKDNREFPEGVEVPEADARILGLNIPSHIQHNVGVTFRFGGSDSDGDGVLDKYDDCVDQPGTAELNGCVDSDKDGVVDSKDNCPLIPGLKELNGCPDDDGDGIPNNQDACPQEYGTVKTNGCPDTDGDGVVDSKDDCPNVVGRRDNNGCPEVDTDGDGVLDKDDNCVRVPGVRSNNGCPEVVKEAPAPVEKNISLARYTKNILFNTSKSSFKKSTYSVLAQLVDVMNEYPNGRFRVEGHTDSTGSLKFNNRLSEKRAKAVKDYLVSKGISPSRLIAKGYGPSRPVDSNETAEGRQNNRRTEIILIK